MVTSLNNPSGNTRPYYEPSAQIKEHMDTNHDHLIKANTINKTKASLHKVSQALTVYPVKGLKGDQNFNFYEFLAMGVIPFTVGSAAMIGVFNGASKHFSPASREAAGKIGKKLGVGVVLYCLAKALANKVVNTAVKAHTGVDLDQPYVKVINELPEGPDKEGKVRIEYHKAFESADFWRTDLFHAEGTKHGNRNEWYDNIARKNGFGDLQASDQEMKPRIRSLIVKTKTAQYLLSYLFAATAVGLAAQSPWEELFVNKGAGKKPMAALKHVGSMFKRSFAEMWRGGKVGEKISKSSKIFGRALLIASALGAVAAPIISVRGFRSKAETKQVIDNSRRSYEA